VRIIICIIKKFQVMEEGYNRERSLRKNRWQIL
jgi:hypothetical protein